MGARRIVCDWLDIRPPEFRVVVLSFLGAFLVMSFGVLAGALRDAFYLGFFDAATLPYVLYASVALGLPAVGVFSRQMGRRPPHAIIRILIFTVAAGLLGLYGLVVGSAVGLDARIAAVVFYLWTVVATLLLTSGFWILASEVFAVREAKRLFGLISAGGALGTLVTGVSISALLERLRPISLVPLLVAFLALGLIVFELFPRQRLRRATGEDGAEEAGRLRGLREVAGDPHLRLVAATVLLTAATGYIVTWQLQDAIQRSATLGAAAAGLQGEAAVSAVNARIASFMGAFRGWTGGLAFVIQVFLASRILAGAGVAGSLALLPLALVFGSAGFLVLPGLFMATLVRGADNTLSKSMYRTVIELLWVPIPSALRRRTKAFIDSMVDSAGNALGALVVLCWVTFAGLPPRVLSVFVIAGCVALAYLARAMGNQYFATLRARLEASGREARFLEGAGLDRADRLGATLTRLDVTRVLEATGLELDGWTSGEVGEVRPELSSHPEAGTGGLIRTGDPELLRRAFDGTAAWTTDDAPALIRLLARDGWVGPAVEALANIGPDAVPFLRAVLGDEGSDFVIRRRVPRVLGRIDDPEADRALVDALPAGRFEVRYRVALALRRRRQSRLAEATGDWRRAVWEAIRAEVGRERPVWELARLLDADPDDDFVERRVGLRGELSLEHTFRLLSLVLEPKTVQAAYHGIILDDPELKSFAQEYLEQVLPADVRIRLWPFIGDLSASAERRAIRKLDDVVADLLQTGATLFGTPESREALHKYLRDEDDAAGAPPSEDAT